MRRAFLLMVAALILLPLIGATPLYQINGDGTITVIQSQVTAPHESAPLQWVQTQQDKHFTDSLPRGKLYMVDEGLRAELQSRSNAAVSEALTDVKSGKQQLLFEKSGNSIEMHDVQDADSISSVLIRGSDETSTDIAVAENVTLANATIRLNKHGEVGAIGRCDDYNAASGICESGWIDSGVPFKDYGTYIEFTVTHFTGYGGIPASNTVYASAQACVGTCTNNGASALGTNDNVTGNVSANWNQNAVVWNFTMSNISRTGTFVNANVSLYNFRISGGSNDDIAVRYCVLASCTTLQTWTIGTNAPTVATNLTWSATNITSYQNVDDATIQFWSPARASGSDTFTVVVDAVSVSVNQNTTTDITLGTNASSYAEGATINASGVFNYSNGSAASGLNVTIAFYNSSNGQKQLRNVTTNSTGGYSDTYTLASSAETGTWKVNVTGWYNSSVYAVNSTTFSVYDPVPAVSGLSVTPSQPLNGSTVTISATVTDNIGLSVVKALIYYPNGTAWQNITLSGGPSYSNSFAAPSTPLGNYTVTVWANDTANGVNNTVTGAFSPAISVTQSANITLDGSLADWSTLLNTTDAADVVTPPYIYDWVDLNATNSPSSRTEFRIVFDKNINKTLLWGGVDEANIYIYNTTDNTWYSVATTSAPAARRISNLAFDEVKNLSIFYGGLDFSGNCESSGTFVCSNTYGYNATSKAWSTLVSGAGETDSGYIMVYDSRKNVTVRQYSSSSYYNGSTNSYGAFVSGIHRADAAMGFDEAINTTLLFGGRGYGGTNVCFGGGSSCQDTYKLNETTTSWTYLGTGGPPNGSTARIVYDRNINKSILGNNWVYDAVNNSWSQITLRTSPSETIYDKVFDRNINKTIGKGPTKTFIFNVTAPPDVSMVEILSVGVADNTTALEAFIRVNGTIGATPGITYRMYIGTNGTGNSTGPLLSLPFPYRYYLQYNGSACQLFNSTGNAVGSCSYGVNANTLEFAVNFSSIGASPGAVMNVTFESAFNASVIDFAPSKDSYIRYAVAAPSITVNGVTISPALAANGTSVNVTVNVTSDYTIGTVLASIYYPNGTLWQNVTLTGSNPYNGSFTSPATPLGNYTVTVWANDSSGSNATSSSTFIPYVTLGLASSITIDGAFSDWGTPPIGDGQANQWTEILPANSPPPTQQMDMDYLPSINSIIMFGGVSSNETWLYNITQGNWTLLNPTNAPTARWEHDLVAVPGRNSIFLFGGWDGSYDGETWVFNASTMNWQQLSPANSPSPRYGQRMVYVSDWDSVLLFGGYNGVNLDDTWIYNFTANNWQQLSPSTVPPSRHGQYMAYDSDRRVAVMYGGYSGGALSSMFEYDLTSRDWQEVYYSGSSGARWNGDMEYWRAAHVIAMLGEAETLDYRLWTYDASARQWTPSTFSVAPSGRQQNALAYVNNSASIYLFGGYNGSGTVSDTWILQRPASSQVNIRNNGSLLFLYVANQLTFTNENVTFFLGTGGAGSAVSPSGAAVPFTYDYYALYNGSSCTLYNSSQSAIGGCLYGVSGNELEMGLNLSDVGLSENESANITLEAISGGVSAFSPPRNSFISYTVAAGDTTPPVISGVSYSNNTDGSVNITWTTDEAANASITYGKTANLGSFGNSSSSLSTGKNLKIYNPAEHTFYYYNITACDGSNNCNTSGPYNFTSPYVICGVLPGNITLTRDVIVSGSCFEPIRDGSVIDGNGHSLTGDLTGFGVNDTGAFNDLTVKNLTIRNFSIGVSVDGAGGVTVTGNTFNESTIGLFMNSSSGYVAGNVFDAVDGNDEAVLDESFDLVVANNTFYLLNNDVRGLKMEQKVYSVNNTFIGTGQPDTTAVLVGLNGVGTNVSIIDSVLNNTGDTQMYIEANNTLVSNVTFISSRAVSLYAAGNGTIFNRSDPLVMLSGVGATFTYMNVNGSIQFLVPVNESSVDLGVDVRINNNSAYVNSSKGGLNRSANVSLYRLPTNFTNPIILRDGVACGNSCYNFTNLNAGNVTFNVTGWSNYTIGEGNVDVTPPVIVGSIEASPHSDSVYMIWDTDEAANFSVDIGATQTLGEQLFESASFTPSHEIDTGGGVFNENTQYYYNITHCDAAGNCATYGPYNFTTPDGVSIDLPVIPAQTPIEGSTLLLSVLFNATDNEGAGTIDNTTVDVRVTLDSVVWHTVSCTNSTINSTTQQFNCTFPMEYYDGPGSWLFMAQVGSNDSNSYSETNFTYNTLKAIQLSTGSLAFGDVGPGGTASASLQIHNTGNFNFTQVNVTASQLLNGSYSIAPGNFTVNISDGAGQALADVPVTVLGAYVAPDNSSGQNNRTLYFRIQAPGALPLAYTSQSAWGIDVG